MKRRFYSFILSLAVFSLALLVHTAWTTRLVESFASTFSRVTLDRNGNQKLLDPGSKNPLESSSGRTPAQELEESVVPTGFSVFGFFNAILLGLLTWLTLNFKWTAEQLAHQMTRRVKQQHEELSAVINGFPGLVSWMGKDLKYLGVSDELAKTFGRCPKDFVGLDVGSVSNTPSGGASFRKSIEEFFLSPESRKSAQLKLESKHGEQHFLTTFQKYDEGQKVMVVSMDVTEQKKLEKQIEETRIKALNSARMSALGEMAGGMAHEINNPLMIIYAKLTAIKRLVNQNSPQNSGSEILKNIEKAETTIERISKIIRGLRTIARDGEKDPFQTTSIQSLIQDAAELCRHRLKSKGIDFVVQSETQASEEVIECRPTQVIQVLLNLIGNSIDALEEGNSSDRKKESEQELLAQAKIKRITLSVTVQGDQVDFRVQDTGPGVPESLKEKIMQPFFTTKEVGKGTGLGLSISKGIAESHHGSLFLDSKVTEGGCFILRIPRVQPEVCDLSPASNHKDAA